MLGILGNNLLGGLVANAASSAVGGIIGALTTDSGQTGFTDLLNGTFDGSVDIGALQTPDIADLANIAQPVAGTLDNSIGNLANQISQNPVRSIEDISQLTDASKVIATETLSEIEKILTDEPILVQSETTTPTTPLAALASEGLSQALSTLPPLTPDSASKASQVQLTPSTLEKEDPRILGEDNLKSLVQNASNKIVKDFSNVTENGLFAESNFADKLDSKDGQVSNSLVSDTNLNPVSNINKKDYVDSIYRIDEIKKAAQEQAAYKVVSVSKNEDTIEVKLDPENLGKLQIRIGFDASGKANLMITAERQDTLDILKKDAAGFEKILGDNGIKSDGGSMSFNLKEQNQQQQQQQWNFFEKPVAFNLQDLINQDEITASNRVSSSAYNDNYSNNLVSILV